MVSGLIVLALIVCGAICNAAMDTVADESHFRSSVFRRWDTYFWLKTRSWTNKYVGGDPTKGLRFKFPFAWISGFLDAWHIFKMLMLIFLLSAVVVALYSKPLIPWWAALIAIYPAWNGTFELFYSFLFKKK